MPKPTITSRKRRPLNRDTAHVRDTKLFIIAAEGEKTEARYFNAFHNTRIQVKVLSTEAGFSAPRHVLERLDAFKQEFDVGPEDELWLALDVDRWPAAQLGEVARGARQRGYSTIISNPCFELWLVLHLVDVASTLTSCSDCEQLLRLHLGGYSKASFDAERLIQNVEDAVERAKALHVNRSERWPSRPGSHVYKIADKLSRNRPAK